MSKKFRTDSGVRKVCIISPWLFNVYMDGVIKEVKMGMGRRGMRFMEDGRECSNFVLYGKLEEDLRAMVGRFVEVCRRKGLKVNGGKSKVVVMNGEEGLECEVHIDGVCLEHVSKYKYLLCVLYKAGTDGAEC